MNKPIKILSKVLIIFVGVALILYVAAYFYITSHKKEILQQFTKSISEKLNGEVKMGDADISFFGSFPRIALVAKDISITDSMYSVHKHPFLTGKELFVNVNIFKLISRKPALTGLRLKNAEIFFYTDTSGYTNTYLMQSKKDPAGGPKTTNEEIQLKSIVLEKVHFTLMDLKREKLHDLTINDLEVKMGEEGDELVTKVNSDINIKGIAFNVPRGTFLKDTKMNGDFLLRYNKKTQVLKFNEIEIDLNDETYKLTGSFDLGDKNPQFDLKIENPETDVDKAKKLLPERIAKSISIVQVDEPVDVVAQLNGPLRGGEPLILAKWSIENTNLKSIFMDFTHVTCTGYYSNEVVKGLPRKDPNSILVLENFKGEWKGLPVTSKVIEILDLQHPILTADLRSGFALTRLNDMLGIQSLTMQNGDADISLQYSGPVEYNSATFARLNGYINIKKGEVKYNPRNVIMQNLNGNIRFQNSDIKIDNISFKVLSNSVVMNGYAGQLMTLFNDDPNKVKISYNIYSPQLNMQEFLFLFKQKQNQVKAAKSDNAFGSFASKLDGILDRGRVDVNLKVDKFLYKKLSATNFEGDVTVLQNEYLLNKIHMNAVGGVIDLKGSVKAAGANLLTASINADVLKVDVNKLFSAFDNFGQDGITANNLFGNLTAHADVALKLKDDGSVLPATANGILGFSLINGQLNNYEPLKKVQKFVFKNRNFDNISFAELKDKFVIKNGDITMNRMEIQSNVITLFVEGLYSKRGKTDLSIQVPLNNLNKREDDYVPQNIGVDAKGGKSIFLRGQTGADGNVAFKLDIFKKFYKDNAPGSAVATIAGGQTGTTPAADSTPVKKKRSRLNRILH